MTATATVAGDRIDHRPTTLLDRVVDATGSVRPLAVLRIALGPCVWLHLRPFVADLRDGIRYDDRFFEPWAPWLPVPPGSVQPWLVALGAAGAFFLMIGYRTRLAAAATFIGVAGNFFLTQTYFRHNRAFLVMLLAAMVLAPVGRALSVDALRTRPSPVQPLWVLWVLRYLAASIYFASGFSKLVDRDWLGGTVLWDRAVRYQHLVHESWLPGPVADGIVDVVTDRAFHYVLSPLAVATELFLAVCLWFGRTRIVALWIAVLFHLSIQFAASVEVFSFIALAALAIWVTPVERDRTVVGGPAWLGLLDWFGRFERRSGSGPLLVIDRDGTEHRGRAAAWLVASRLPLTFMVAAPVRRFR